MKDLDISKLNSARVIEDPEEIALALRKAEAGRRGVEESEVDLKIDKEGHVLRRKATGLAVAQKQRHLGAAKLQALVEARGMPWDEGYVGRDVPYFLSDERVDGHGDIVLQNWIFDVYEDNPVLAFSHYWDSLSIGVGIDWNVVNRVDDKYTGRALFFRALFATEEMQGFADMTFRMVEAGMFRGISAGFYPGMVIWIEDDDERAEYGLGRYGYVLDQNTLLEGSPTLLPANAGSTEIEATLAKAKKRGLLLAGDLPVLRELERRRIAASTRSIEEWGESEGLYRRVARLLFPESVFRKHEDLDEPIDGAEPEDEQIVVAVEGAPEEDDLGEKIDGLAALVSEGFGSVLATLDDVREHLETREATRGADDSEPDEGDEDEEDTDGLESASGENRIESVLAKVEEFRRTRGTPASP